MADTALTSNPYSLIGPSEDGQVDDLLVGLKDKDACQRLQALIAEWLRMENLVVLTGAGTSVSAGGKTINRLEEAVLARLIHGDDGLSFVVAR